MQPSGGDQTAAAVTTQTATMTTCTGDGRCEGGGDHDGAGDAELTMTDSWFLHLPPRASVQTIVTLTTPPLRRYAGGPAQRHDTDTSSVRPARTC